MGDPRSLPSLLQTLVISAESGKSNAASRKDAAPHLAFAGNWQDPCPRLLLLDPALEPVDIVTWQVIRIHVEPGKLVAFPTYQDLMRWVRVSRATVARAVTVLRLARWLPLSASVRDASGRFQGSVYALHDEPLPLAEMLRADERYVRFAQQARGHRHAHVRKLAGDVCSAIDALVLTSDAGACEPTDLGQHIATRFDRMLHLLERDQASTMRTEKHHHRGRVQNLNSAAQTATAVSRVQDLNERNAVQNLNSGRRSGSSSHLKTTTTGSVARAKARPSGFPPELLLTDSQRRVLVGKLERLPDAERQDVLDEGAGRILAKRRSTDPVRCEFDYIAKLIASALIGEFTLTDLGERYRNKRLAKPAGEARLKRARELSEVRRREELAAFEARQSRAGTIKQLPS